MSWSVISEECIWHDLRTIKWTCFCVLSVIEAKVQAPLLQQSSLVYSQAILGVLCSLPTLKNKNNQHTHTHTHTHTCTCTLHIHTVSEWPHTTAGNWNKLRTNRRGGGVDTLIAALVLGLKVNRWAPRAVPNAVADQMCRIPWGWELQTEWAA